MKTLLIIEGDKVIRENTKELLEFSNYQVVTVENGNDGLKIAYDLMPDLVLCNIIMPMLCGYQVLKQLAGNKKTASIPFIFLSTKCEKADIKKGMNLGADDYITKPFNEEDLLEAIESRLAKF